MAVHLRGDPFGLYGPVHQGNTVPLVPGETRVLVTGAAGFIGMSLLAELSNKGIQGLGMDDYTGFYSIALKEARAARLKREFNIRVLNQSACDQTRVTRLLASERITHVVHLAAQPGVRFSITHPLRYVDTNIKCFTSLLESIIAQPRDARPHFVYASSSSVYGLNDKLPFSEYDRVDRPSNLYGATKRSDEQIALAYEHLHGLPSSGCRFFTVYGPWGRPDMALFKFADKIDKGLPIPIYNKGQMRRDFTFVDDIVDGIIRVMEFRDADGGAQVFNLGNNKPEELMYLIQLLEWHLGKQAIIEDAGDSPGDIEATFADITLSREILGYKPKTSLKEGVARFIAWYRSPEHQDGFSYVSENPITRSGRPGLVARQKEILNSETAGTAAQQTQQQRR